MPKREKSKRNNLSEKSKRDDSSEKSTQDNVSEKSKRHDLSEKSKQDDSSEKSTQDNVSEKSKRDDFFKRNNFFSIKKIITFIGVLFLINTIHMVIINNFHAGLIALAVFSIAIFMYGRSWDKLKKAKWLHITVAAVCLILILFSASLSHYGKNDNVQYDEDAVIILGAGIRGEQPGRALTFRLNKAVEYHEKNPDAVFIVSGGQGPNEKISEALAMERYLVENGVPIAKIIKEDSSTTTYENFTYSGDVLRREFPQGFSAAFITNNFHVYRAERIAEGTGLSVRHMGAGISWYSIPVNYLREMMAVMSNWLFP